jgi:hypothetical protein
LKEYLGVRLAQARRKAICEKQCIKVKRVGDILQEIQYLPRKYQAWSTNLCYPHTKIIIQIHQRFKINSKHYTYSFESNLHVCMYHIFS